ncbi:unnamed protein product [Periconia digitata]|uniref:Uncharacterized protein n=1 Tax=Periconia digitata TaxID=1303443 RepID=A0A9W4UAK4_9PLEO|nr:unnamed protein product [Periconia digitata]
MTVAKASGDLITVFILFIVLVIIIFFFVLIFEFLVRYAIILKFRIRPISLSSEIILICRSYLASVFVELISAIINLHHETAVCLTEI